MFQNATRQKNLKKKKKKKKSIPVMHTLCKVNKPNNPDGMEQAWRARLTGDKLRAALVNNGARHEQGRPCKLSQMFHTSVQAERETDQLECSVVLNGLRTHSTGSL
jgi:hypothetical protein